MPSTHEVPRVDALVVAATIADHLCRERLESGGECTWLGWTQRETDRGDLESVYETCGPAIYGGTSGIALFLAEVYARTKEAEVRRTAVAALNHALARTHEIHARFRVGFYCGTVGVAHAAVAGGRLLDRQDLVAKGVAMLGQLSNSPDEECLLDVISGAAGAIPTLLALAGDLLLPELRRWVERLGDRIMAAAIKTEAGWSWGDDSTGFRSARPLTGLGHGAAGFGWALLELFSATGEERFLSGAEQAFNYERSWFREPPGNWPDFRYFDGESEPPPYGVAWCQGAPGIGLTRLRALEIRPDEHYRGEVAAALRAVTTNLDDAPPPADRDFSLCHGLGGIGEFLLETARVLKDSDSATMAYRLAAAGADRHGVDPAGWRCGVSCGTNPSLMLGLAGIGYFFLHTADPTLTSILLAAPGRLQP